MVALNTRNLGRWLYLQSIIWISVMVFCQAQSNKAPVFLFDGDMARFSIKEDTPIGTIVYTLRATDPEGSRIAYGITSDYFSVGMHTGDVILTASLDREVADSVEVVIMATDEKLFGTSNNTIQLKRQIPVLDANDNAPKFLSVPYVFAVEETASVGTLVFDGIIITDKDAGINAEISLECVRHLSPEACQLFDVAVKERAPGEYQGLVTLKNSLDYEERSMYILTLRAEDMGLTGRKSSMVNIIVEVKDRQDQPPVFLNAPYFVALAEGTPPDMSVLTISVQDGDKGSPNPLEIRLKDENRYFKILSVEKDDAGLYSATVGTTENILNREDPQFVKSDGQYTFQIEAVEINKNSRNAVSSLATVIILITDVNDNWPQVSSDSFNISISEDTPINSLLAELDLTVIDMDLDGNARYNLLLESEDNSGSVFSIVPKVAHGLMPIGVMLANASMIDYEDEESRKFNFRVVAVDDLGRRSQASVRVDVQDANDNSPVFERQHYDVEANENSIPGTVLATITAVDADSGIFGELSYQLLGFGAEWFDVNMTSGELTVADCGAPECLDHENRPEYILTYVVRDGSGRSAAAALTVSIRDVNDNPPSFVQRELIRNVQAGTLELAPPLVVKATDKDGPGSGNSDVTYRLDGGDDAFFVDPNSGEIGLKKALERSDTAQFIHLHVIAEDKGTPPLKGDAYVIITVTDVGENQIFFVHPVYNASVLETDQEGQKERRYFLADEILYDGTNVIQVVAVVTAIADESITYRIASGAQDNFVIDALGTLSIAQNASLDLEYGPKEYNITVEAVLSGTSRLPVATTTVHVMVDDVNNKPPAFRQDYYVAYVSLGDETDDDVILVVEAFDPDANPLLQYSIEESMIAARDTAGVLMSTEAMQDFKDLFRINATSGEIRKISPVDHSYIYVVYLTVKVRDNNANLRFGEQTATAEVVVYVEQRQDFAPSFPPPWTLATPQIVYSIPEEPPVGSVLFTLTARNPNGNGPIRFEKLEDEHSYIAVDETEGVVTLQKRLDFEALSSSTKHVTFLVKAIAGGSGVVHSSTGTVIIDVQDINDNSPIFSQESYQASVSESATYPHVVLVVHATDLDRQFGFGKIVYSLNGDDGGIFTIDPNTGTISLAKGRFLDREAKAAYVLKVTATDNPEGNGNQRRASALVSVEVTDVNDNAPVFLEPLYQAIIPETVAPGFHIKQVKADDVDLGGSARVIYSLDPSSELKEYLVVNKTSGHLVVGNPLSGKGRIEPYKVVVRATDQDGEEDALSANVHVLLFITDVSTNDGIPSFVKPLSGDLVTVAENSPAGTVVTLVEASDPDDPRTDSGRLRYSFLGEGSASADQMHFSIDPVRGTITTRDPLDYETKKNYTVVVVVRDFGSPPQHRAQFVNIFVTDVDDHPPRFLRPKNSVPLEMEVEEEVLSGIPVGFPLEAVDEDELENAAVQYAIIDGNEGSVFAINTTTDNRGMITVSGRLDRETKRSYLLTIQVKPASSKDGFQGTFDPSDLSMMQVSIEVTDIDDNPPIFVQGNTTIGIKASTEPEVDVFTFHAVDADDANDVITYALKKIHFYFLREDVEAHAVDGGFYLHRNVLRTTNSMSHYDNGYFVVNVEATSGNRTTDTNLTIFVLEGRELLKFVFNKPLAEVQKSLANFRDDLQQSLRSPHPITVNLYDSHFAAQEMAPNASSLCFNFFNGHSAMSSDEVEAILDLPSRPRLAALYRSYGVDAVEACSKDGELYTMNWIEICVLVVAALIAITAVVSAVVICRLHKQQKLATKKLQRTVYQVVRGAALVADTNGNGYSTINRQRIHEWQERSTPTREAATYGSSYA